MPGTLEEVVVAGVNNFKPAKGGLLKLVFGNAYEDIVGVEKIDIDIYDGKRGQAGYAARGTTGTTIGNEGWDTIQVKPPLIKESFVITARDLAIRKFGEGNINNTAANESKFQTLYDRNYKTISNRKIRAATNQVVQALTTGKIVIVETDDKGKALAPREVDFLMPATHIYTVATPWTNVSADIIKDDDTINREIVKDSGLTGDYTICGSETIMNMLKNDGVSKILDNRRMTFGEMFKKDLGDGLTSWGVLNGREIFTFLDFNEDGTEVIPVNAYIMGSREAELDILYASVDVIVNDMPVIATGKEIVSSDTDKEAVAKKMTYQTAVLYCLTQSSAFACLTTA